MSKFERIFVVTDLERAVAETIALWYPVYAEELRLQRAMTTGLPMLRSITNRDDVTKYPEDQLPAAIVASPGLAPVDPREEGDGFISAWYEIVVAVVASAATERDTELVTKMHGALIRTILLQQGSLDGFASGVRWVDESFDDFVSDDQERSLAAQIDTFHFHVDDVVNRWAGPTGPPPNPGDPGSEWPTANTIIIDIEAMPLVEE